MLKKRAVMVVLAGIMLCGALYAGTTGKIAGRVFDQETGDPLPGANVVIVGTKIGTATDLDGYYYLINIQPGVYTLRASMIGYNPQEVTDVVVKVDLTTNINFYLTSTAIRTEEIVVTAQRELVERTATETRRVVSQENISQLPYTNFQSAIQMQAGVTGVNVIRGGRDDEVAYYVDGMLINSPVYGTFYGYINTSAIQEMSLITGGFNAEYGQALSGVINVVTREGGTKTSGDFTIRSDGILPEKLDYGSTRTTVTLGGPVPFTNKKVRYFVSGETFWRDGAPSYNYIPEDDEWYPILNAYENGTDAFRAFVDTAKVWWYDPTQASDPNYAVKPYWKDYYNMAKEWKEYFTDRPYLLPHSAAQNYYLQGKLSFLPLENLKIMLAGNLAKEQNQTYHYGTYQWYKYRGERNRVNLTRRYQTTLTINHILRNNLFYTLNLGYFYSRTRVGILDPNYQPYWFDKYLPSIRDYLYSRRIDELFSDYRFVGYVPDPPTEKVIIPGYYMYNFGPGNPWGVGDQSHVNFASTGDYRVINRRIEQTYSGKWDLTWQANKYHELKAGLEFRYHDINYYHNSLPWDQNPFLDIYDTNPYQASAYVQDKMEFEGLVVNAGLRFDYMDPKQTYYISIAGLGPNDVYTITPEDTMAKDVKPKYQLSPRLGISHPVTERQVLHFAYGYFFQTPPLEYFYTSTHMNIDEIMSRGNQLVGNPDLNAEKQIAFEVGLANQLNDFSAIDVTAFYKDVYQWVGSRKVKAIPMSFYIYTNAAYGNSKGVEVTYQLMQRDVNLRLAYTLQFAEGTESDPFEAYENLYYSYLGTDPITGEPAACPASIVPLNYDHRHTINASITYSTPEGLVPYGILDNVNVSLIHRSQSGAPYTPRDLRGNIVGDINSERTPWSHNTDLTVSKGINVFGKILELRFEGFNIFNIKNVVGVYPTTGLPNDDGYAKTLTVSMFGNSNIYLGQTGYNPLRDINGDGILTPQEMYESYILALKDYLATPANYGEPIQLRFALVFRF
ncbi:MAG TPA: TonB-dependent receptor [Candidatus Hydrothermia bacterium]|nr:TonB-dependent receptor [Candidatus Hydrothermia bacterium]